MIFTINKGSHFSNNLLYKVLNFLNFKSKITCEVIFDHSCKYDLGTTDQLDINKLIGFSCGYHHNNSARFGWRYSQGKIELFSYCYISGQRIYKKICDADINQPIKMELVDNGNCYLYRVFVDNRTYISKVDKNNSFSIGYKLWPYFGGNCKAPHTINISINYQS